MADPVEVIIVAVGVLGGVAGLFIIGRLLKRSMEQVAVWRLGRPERARIVWVRETGAVLGRHRHKSHELEIVLEVEGSGARHTMSFFAQHAGREVFQEDAILDVRLAEDDPTQLAIDPALRV